MAFSSRDFGVFLADVTKACLKVTNQTLKALVHSLRCGITGSVPRMRNGIVYCELNLNLVIFRYLTSKLMKVLVTFY